MSNQFNGCYYEPNMDLFGKKSRAGYDHFSFISYGYNKG